MRGKKARAARKAAQKVAKENAPYREYFVAKKGHTRVGTPLTPETPPSKVTPPGTFELDPGCIRALTQQAKKYARVL